MGVHYWASLSGPINESTQADDFVPIFLLFNRGRLNGFGWLFNADLKSPRYEHPPQTVGQRFFKNSPTFFQDSKKSQSLTSLHIFLDKTPYLNFC